VENKTAAFNGTIIRYVTFGKDGNDLLLNTEDICRVLGITDRPEGTDLALKDMDLQSAGVFALRYDKHLFFEWLQEEFAGYSLEVLLRPH
jgi:hypothetical protein